MVILKAWQRASKSSYVHAFFRRNWGEKRAGCWILIASCLAYAACDRLPSQSAPRASEVNVAKALGGDSLGFAQVTGPRPFDFPRDHGPHPDYKTEWWYFTGNVQTEAGQRFGYQFTIFRIGLVPPGSVAPRASRWAADEIYMGHFAVTDVGKKSFIAGERLARAALDLAGARAHPLTVWVENWRVQSVNDLFPLHISAEYKDVAIDLTLDSRKPVVLQGEQGYSAKSSTPGNASHYYSYTRLATAGTLRVGGVSYAVRGESWMDREWSTSALENNQEGWDWFSLQLDDGTELMYYRLRFKDGGVDPASAGTWIDAQGNSERLTAADVHATAVRHWRSPATHTRYPIAWKLSVPSHALELAVEPLIDDQELRLTVRYWEGAVRVVGRRSGRSLSGYGYLELAGYAD